MGQKEETDRKTELIELVKRMRRKQKEYFRRKDANVYVECRELERTVDAALEDYEKSKYGEELFQEETYGKRDNQVHGNG